MVNGPLQKKRLIGVGGGPRNAAIAVSAHILREIGIVDVDFRIMEESAIGANWTGEAGYTNGAFPLDTEPLKDLTFPRTGFGLAADNLSARFSFITFLKTREDQFERWVSAGGPAISHGLFAEYQIWAMKETQTAVLHASVQSLRLTGGGIELSATANTGETLLMQADGVVISGPGAPKRLRRQDDDPERILNTKTYWSSRDQVKKMIGARIAVIGSGQSAGTIAQSILEDNPAAKVDVINRFGFLPVLSTGFHENFMVSSANESWKDIPVADRIDILHRINIGTVANYIKELLDRNANVNVKLGWVESVLKIDQSVQVTLSSNERLEYDAVVIAIGFSPLDSLSHLMPDSVHSKWFRSLAKHQELDYHLRIPKLSSSIHIPSLAALSQGPGLALLSCLATMANRVMSAYVNA